MMEAGLKLRAAELDALMPMHVAVDSHARIVGAGRALRRITGPRAAVGQDFFDGFRVLRPEGVETAQALFNRAGRALTIAVPLTLRTVTLRGHLVRIGGGAGLLNLALGVSDLPDLGGADLTAADFAPTDPTLDMLYLMEAKELAFAESRRLIRRLQEAKTRAEEAALTDALTGLGNRRALDLILSATIADGQSFALCHVDLDYFKSVNDSLGHAAGDAVLREVAERLSAVVRASDTVARVGGDEFMLLLPGMLEVDRLEEIAARIVGELGRPVPFGERTCRISASIGISLSTDYDPPDANRIIADADAALYASKGAGRSRHMFHDPGHRRDRGPPGEPLALGQARRD